MRWVKHLSMAHADQKIDEVLEEFGAEAYGVYWLIVEDIAAPMEPGKMDPIGSHSVAKWSSICRVSARKLRSIVNRLREKNLIDCISTIDRLQISVPNILKYKDEYSKKSGLTPDLSRDRERAEAEQKQREKEPAAPLPPSLGEARAQLKASWEAHRCYRNGESIDHALRIILSLDCFDWKELATRHPPWCEYWASKGWNAFGSLTFIGWIQAGMPPPPQGEVQKKPAFESKAERVRREIQEMDDAEGK